MISYKEKNSNLNISFNKTEKIYVKNKCLPDLLWEQVRIYPQNIAVECGSEKLTFHELAENSLELAMHLHSTGVKADDLIGIFIEPSIDLMISVWGILMSGGAYLPLSPEYPHERLRYMIQDSGTKIIITQEKLKEKLSELVPDNVKIITLSDTKEFIKSSHPAFKIHLRSNNLAYIIYTSGSTGKPKGVMIEHHSIVNQMGWLKNTFQLNSESIILQKTPISFDAAQWEILAVCCGSKVVMGYPGLYKNPGKLIETIIQYKVNMLQCVPTLLQALIDTNEFHYCKTLSHVFSGGEALTQHLAVECLNILPSCHLINLYGPTEGTINTSAYTVDLNLLPKDTHTISIGKPINNMQYYVFNDTFTPIRIGETGELYIGGAGIARGYLNRPEMTAEKFIDNPFKIGNRRSKLYKTGDLVYKNIDGTFQYIGRIDNQIKLRGYRIELDEIKSTIETHDWIKNAAVIVKTDSYTKYENLVAFIELDSKEAVLMDQGNHDPHHQSKASKAQVMMQLSNKGCREQDELHAKTTINLPGKIPTSQQIHSVFARKTYRFFEGDEVKKSDIMRLLSKKSTAIDNAINLNDLTYNDFGQMLRYFGQYISEERLLPKYGYASPGALYATQMYLELDGICDLKSGYYYYHPVYHQLVFIKEKASTGIAQFKLHFIGKNSAIEPIYKNNIQEVLEIETGHMLGLWEKILPDYGLNIQSCEYTAIIKQHLEVAEEDFYLGTFQITSEEVQPMEELVDIYVQIHPEKVADLKTGLYQYINEDLQKISDEIILRKQVIAINQEVYNRSSFGITAVSKTDDWMSYINLGRKLQKLQMNDINIGLMSSGYSSKSDHDLPSAKRIRAILNQDALHSYFFIGGRVSDEQIYSHGMKEDTVHMKGPAEMIRDDLVNILPEHMVPNKIIVLDKMPLTANGKVDFNELKNRNIELVQREYVAPTTVIEQKIHNIWKNEIKRENISTTDNFFELGGNSLIAVSLINKINKELNSSLSLQVLFEAPNIQKLASKLEANGLETCTRLIKLQPQGARKPLYCWPGLGGYCMNLRLLASQIDADQPFYGIQAYGINKNETAYPSIEEMAAEDIKLIKEVQPVGPYVLAGYSFGARVAFETAYQLEKSGDVVENLFLIAPGIPRLQENRVLGNSGQAVYSNKIYVTILFSVFMGNITHQALDECLQVAQDEESFINYIVKNNSQLEPEMIKKIISVVAQTYELRYSVDELNNRKLNTPITVFKARGDDYSFIEEINAFSSAKCTIIESDIDHYHILKNPAVGELAAMIKKRLHNCYSVIGLAKDLGNSGVVVK